MNTETNDNGAISVDIICYHFMIQLIRISEQLKMWEIILVLRHKAFPRGVFLRISS